MILGPEANRRRLRGTGMSLLSRIEGFYLSILRVIILTAATIALIVVVLGFVRSAPLIAEQLGMKQADQRTTGGNLSEFITEKRAEGTEVSLPDASDSNPRSIPKSIKDAVALLASYDKKRLGEDLNIPSAEGVLMERFDAVQSDYQNTYADEVKGLMQQLTASKGKPLSIEKINELINWHFKKFQQSIEEQTAKRAAENVQAIQAMTVSAVALMAFLLIVFCFIFVKIERNLRTVRISGEMPQNPAATKDSV